MRQLKFFIYLFLTTFTLTLAACSHNNHAVAPQNNATNAGQLIIPQGLNNTKMEDYYPVPKLEKQPSTTATAPVSIVPPGSALDKKQTQKQPYTKKK